MSILTKEHSKPVVDPLRVRCEKFLKANPSAGSFIFNFLHLIPFSVPFDDYREYLFPVPEGNVYILEAADIIQNDPQKRRPGINIANKSVNIEFVTSGKSNESFKDPFISGDNFSSTIGDARFRGFPASLEHLFNEGTKVPVKIFGQEAGLSEGYLCLRFTVIRAGAL